MARTGPTGAPISLLARIRLLSCPGAASAMREPVDHVAFAIG